MAKFSILGTTKAGSTKMILRDPRLFNSLLKELDGNISVTVEELKEDATGLQIWHFRKVVVPLVLKLTAKAGNIMSEEEVELLLLHEVCKLSPDRSLDDDLNKEEIGQVIDHSKNWINKFFSDFNETSNKII